jgi:hypothetical protein
LSHECQTCRAITTHNSQLMTSLTEYGYRILVLGGVTAWRRPLMPTNSGDATLAAEAAS